MLIYCNPAYRRKYVFTLFKNICRWFCHFDDDVYVNTKILSSFLKRYDSTKEYYFGRGRQLSCKRIKNIKCPKAKMKFSYALGAGYCLSAALMKKMEIYFRGENFVATCSKLSLPDDAAIGAVVGKVHYQYTFKEYKTI